MVQDARKDLRAFDAMIAQAARAAEPDHERGGLRRRLRGRHREAQAAASTCRAGWERSPRRAASSNSPAGERETLRNARTIVDVMDEEVAALGRSTSARYSAEDAGGPRGARPHPANSSRSRGETRPRARGDGGLEQVADQPRERLVGSTARARSTPHHASAPSPLTQAAKAISAAGGAAASGGASLITRVPDPHPALGGGRSIAHSATSRTLPTRTARSTRARSRAARTSGASRRARRSHSASRTQRRGALASSAAQARVEPRRRRRPPAPGAVQGAHQLVAVGVHHRAPQHPPGHQRVGADVEGHAEPRPRRARPGRGEPPARVDPQPQDDVAPRGAQLPGSTARRWSRESRVSSV